MNDSTYSRRLKKFAQEAGLTQLVRTITHPTESGGTLIDLVFSNYDDKFECTVYDTPRISDHYIVSIQAQIKHPNKSETVISRGKIDYCQINTMLSLRKWVYHHDSIDHKCEYFCSVLRGVLECVSPLKTMIIRPRYKEWWNDHVRDAIGLRDSSYRRYRQSGLLEDRMVYKYYRNQAVKIIRSEKCKFYEGRIDQCKNDSKRMWRTLKDLISGKKARKVSKIKISDEEITDIDLLPDKLNEFFVGSIDEIVSQFGRTNGLCRDVGDGMVVSSFHDFRLVDRGELRKIVFLLPNKGSPDDLTAEFLKNVYDNIEDPLLNLVNTSLLTGKVPSILKISTIVPVPKKKTPVSAEDFRPVNMLATVEKILERVIYNQLMEYVTAGNILISNQSGFRKSHSCETALQDVLYDWRENVERNMVTGAVFLDLQRAFETVDRNILIYKLRKVGIDGTVLEWFVDYLDGRRQVTKINNMLSLEVANHNGVPQGSVLGPLLFLLYFNDVFLMVKRCSIHLFADDTLIYYACDDPNDLVNVINQELQNVLTYTHQNLLKINSKKSKFMLIGSNLNYNKFLEQKLRVCIGQEDIEIVEKIKYLGFIIDRGLTFKEHVQYIIDKISKNVNFLYRVGVFLSQFSRLLVYNTLVLPHFTYSASILYFANKNELDRLKKLQNRAMRIILRANRYTPIRNMLIALNWLDVESYLEYHVLCLVYRIKSGLTPTYLTEKLVVNSSVHDYPTRSNDQFRVSRKNKRCTERALYHSGLIKFNSLPLEIRASPSLSVFRGRLRVHLLESR